MRRGMVTSFVAVAFLLLSLPEAQAEVPGQFNYQGYLTDSDGIPIGIDPPVQVDMWFSIYDQEIVGTERWSEGPVTVTVDGGVFNAILGQTNPIAPDFVDGPCWLEVIVDGEYLAPRERIVSVLFALVADDADTVDGIEAAALEESAEIDGDIAVHASVAAAHHTKTSSFAELTDAATDAQIPDNITVSYAGEAGYASTALDADTLDGVDSTSFASLSMVSSLQAQVTALVNAVEAQEITIAALETTVASLDATVANMEALMGAVLDLGQYMSVAGTEITFAGANVHIVNGTGSTDGTVNGLGNLIVGYNELRDDGTDDRTGSHNIVFGQGQNYSSYGGLAGGFQNTISGPLASVSGGSYNEARGYAASVSGGSNNQAIGDRSSVSGGDTNTASSIAASVSGGKENEASGMTSSVSGGYLNNATESYTSVGGGKSNTASGESASVIGGAYNEASADSSTVSGGSNNTTDGAHAVVVGGYFNAAGGWGAVVSGGYSNEASGWASSVGGGGGNIAGGGQASVSGGRNNEASGDYSSVSGGGGDALDEGNVAFGHYASILGGLGNIAGDRDLIDHTIGAYSTVSGGHSNTASGECSFVGGGGQQLSTRGNEAFGDYSVVLGGIKNISGDPDRLDHTLGSGSVICGGYYNNARGWGASVSGGGWNIASGDQASVSGGSGRTAGGTNDWAAGSLWEDE